jgi:hypothetical protein
VFLLALQSSQMSDCAISSLVETETRCQNLLIVSEFSVKSAPSFRSIFDDCIRDGRLFAMAVIVAETKSRGIEAEARQ